MTPLGVLLLFLALSTLGALGTVIVFRAYEVHVKRSGAARRFSINKYILYLSFPLLSVVLAAVFLGIAVLFVFFVFMIVGTAFEWYIGWTYHTLMNERLWTYHRLSIACYTSFLSAPLWGIVGVLFWLLARLFIMQ